MITLLFTTHRWNLLSQLIEWRTNGEWSHVEVLEPSGKTCIGARYIRGVERRDYFKAMLGASRHAHAYVDLEPGREALFWDFMEKQIGRPYDWRGALGIGVNDRHWQQPDKWFCSELVAAAFEYAGYRSSGRRRAGCARMICAPR